MVQIVLTDEQARVAREAPDRLELCDPAGRLIGHVIRGAAVDRHFTPEEIAEIAKRSRTPGPRYTTAQVLEHLDILQREGK